MGQSCAVVVPCYNEAARLDTAAFERFLAAGLSISFVFVDDGSTDGTLAILRSIEQRNQSSVRVLAAGKNSGKAEAVRRGMLLAIDSRDAPVVGFWDADLATPLEAIPQLLEVLEATPGVDWVFGARVNLLGRRIERSAARHYLGRVFATVVSTMLRLPVYDTQCGAKLFRVSPELRQVLAEPFQSRWIFDVEMIARLLRIRGLDAESVRRGIHEFPLHTWRDIAGSKVRPADFIRAIVEIAAIYRRYLA